MAINKLTGRGPGFKDLSGKRFGRLCVISFSHSAKPSQTTRTFWRCQCDCGTIVILSRGQLVNGNTKSCGCYRKELATTHGLSRTREYRAWADIKSRCYNPTCHEFHNYGGRDVPITMCDEWRDDFAQFLADMGPCPPGLTIDRIDNNANYSKDNCRWATRTQQVRNRRSSILLTHNGETLPMAEWAERMGLSYETLLTRYRRGRPLFVPQKWFWRANKGSSDNDNL